MHERAAVSHPLVVLAALILVGSAASALPAQQPAVPPEGSRVRVWPATKRAAVVGTVYSSDASGLTVRRSDDTLLGFTWSGVDSLQVSRGRHGGLGRQGALLGAGIGGLTLAGLAATSESSLAISNGAGAAMGFVLGAAGGAAIGAIIGGSRASDDWESRPVPTRTGARPMPPSPRRVASVTVARFR